jgi:chitin synthase
VKPILSEKLPDLTEITNQLYSTKINVYSDVIWWTIAIQVISSYICYIFGKFACKIQIQIFSFSLPINTSVPLTISTLIIITGLRHTDLCAFHGYLPDYIFFRVPPEDFLFTFIVEEFSWIWVFWIFSQCWVTRHLWRPKGMRNASTEKLFILPIYDGLIIDQSLAMNRRRDEYEEFVDIEVRFLYVFGQVLNF